MMNLTREDYQKLFEGLSKENKALVTFLAYILDMQNASIANQFAQQKAWLHDWFISMKGNGLL